MPRDVYIAPPSIQKRKLVVFECYKWEVNSERNWKPPEKKKLLFSSSPSFYLRLETVYKWIRKLTSVWQVYSMIFTSYPKFAPRMRVERLLHQWKTWGRKVDRRFADQRSEIDGIGSFSFFLSRLAFCLVRFNDSCIW